MEKLKDLISFHAYRAILTLQEAYSAILPYLLILSLITLVIAFLKFSGVEPVLFDVGYFRSILEGLDLFSSVVIVISVAYFFAQRYDLSAIIAATLALATYVTVMVTEESGVSITAGYTHGFAIQTLFIPVFSTVVLHWLYPRLSLKFPLNDHNMHIYRMFDYLYAFVAAYLLVLVGYEGLDWVLDHAIDRLEEATEGIALPPLVEVALRKTGGHLLWFLGIHGDFTVQSIFGKAIQGDDLFTNLTTAEFIRLFVTPGGAGAGMGLLIALLVLAREGILRTVARISIPLVVFNINTLLIYAVVVFNPFLLGAFILTPLLNMLIAYTALIVHPVAFEAHDVLWNMPVFYNAYLKSGGDGYILGLQLMLIVIDSVIYGYALRRYFRSQSQNIQVLKLERALNLPHITHVDSRVQSFLAHRRILTSSLQLEKVLEKIHDDNMLLYFQPKISLQTGACDHFEALLRYRYLGGKITYPDFMPLLEETGLSTTIDVWVAQKAGEILSAWSEREHFRPTISINLHPDTLVNPSALSAILDVLEGHSIVFEIIERSFAGEARFLEGLRKIQDRGFAIAIDDYGVGYSNLESLITQRIEEIKLDKILLDRLSHPKGRIVYRHIITLGHDLNLRIVSEGVETHEQALMLAQMGVDMAQGFYFSRALPPKEVPGYARTFDLGRYLPERLTIRHVG